MSSKYLGKPSHIGYASAVEYRCDYCGTACWESRGSYEKRKRHFCGQACYSLFRTELLPKEEHNTYGHGHSPDERKRRLLARSTTNHAIRDGKLIAMPCEVCGNVAEAHHDDYNQPLLVRWLCFNHHRQYHRYLNHPELLNS